MKKYIPIIIFLFLIVFPSALYAMQYTVTRVLDGNTIGIKSFHIEMKITLVGIQAPAVYKGQAGPSFGQHAIRYLAGLVLNKKVQLKRYGTGPGNRIFGVIYQGTTNVNLEMIKAGLARVNRKNLPKRFDITPYLIAEKQAMETGKGMWAK